MSDAPPPLDGGCWLFEVSASSQVGDMRVTTAFKRLLRLPVASVVDVSSVPRVVVTVRLRRRSRRVCGGCGQIGRRRQIDERRVKRWRQLDLGGSGCIIDCELRLFRCRTCGVRMEPVRDCPGFCRA